MNNVVFYTLFGGLVAYGISVSYALVRMYAFMRWMNKNRNTPMIPTFQGLEHRKAGRREY